MEETSKSIIYQNHKRHFSTNGSILLPLVLKWRLFGFWMSAIFAALIIPCTIAGTASAASITLEIPGNLSLSVIPDDQLHTQESDPIKITSDAYGGYTFTIKSEDGTNTLKNGAQMLPSIDDAMTESDFSINHWGYRLTKTGAPSSFQYQPGFTTGTQIDKTDEANETANEYTFILAAKVDNEMHPGTYSNTFTMMVIANDVPYTINYDLNGGSGGPTKNPQTGSGAEGSEITLATAPTRDGYEFKGWCSQATNSETCAGYTYQPETIYKLTNSSNSLTLYAMWEEDSTCLFDGQKVTEIIDTRGGKEEKYQVRKLKDGKCWMVENLRLGSNEEETVLNGSDTDIPLGSTFTLPKGEKTGWVDSQSDTAHIYVDPNPNYGGYYNWFAATTGEGTLDKQFEYDYTEHSICPLGWHLPTMDEIKTLTEKYTDDIIKQGGPDAFRTSWAGHCDGIGCPRMQGSYGYWVSADPTERFNVYFLASGNNDFYRGDNYKGRGYSVRCVGPIGSMQNVAEWADRVMEGETVTAVDKRDGNTYSVARLADGKLWMTQNLRIGSNSAKTVLDSTNTDIASGSSFELLQGEQSGWVSRSDTAHIYMDPEHGGYYTWFAATAGEGTVAKTSGATQHSICPKGWRLPTASEINELTKKYSAVTAELRPAKFQVTYSCRSEGCPYTQTQSQYSDAITGRWWTANASSELSAYTLFLDRSTFSNNTGNKGYGYPVRCVSRQ